MITGANAVMNDPPINPHIMSDTMGGYAIFCSLARLSILKYTSVLNKLQKDPRIPPPSMQKQ